MTLNFNLLVATKQLPLQSWSLVIGLTCTVSSERPVRLSPKRTRKMATTDDHQVFSGVPSTFQDLYAAILFFVCLYLAGDVICRRWLRIVPSLVGHILVANGSERAARCVIHFRPLGQHGTCKNERSNLLQL